MTTQAAFNSSIVSVIAGSGFGTTTDASRRLSQGGRVVAAPTTAAVGGNVSVFPGDDVILPINCNVWADPSRIALQVVLLLILFINIVAAVIVFSVKTNVRGKHVSFLFGCVRTLNVLDMMQCVVLFLFPMFMPDSCNPNPVLCNFSGYLFATSTLFSPLVAIIMAVDRAVAVYYHVWYKNHPYVKTKWAILGGLLGVFGFYFTLPFYTDFGNYVAVPWLDVCSFEWGVKYRAFNLVLALSNTALLMVLLAANIAIVVKVRKRQKQMKHMKSAHEKSKQQPPFNRWSIRKKMHKSADDIVDMSGGEDSAPGTPKDDLTPGSSVFRKRMSKSRPPNLNIPQIDRDPASDPPNSLSPKQPRTTSSRFSRTPPTMTLTPPLTPLMRAKTSSASCRRPRKANPTSAGSNLLTPPALDPLNPRPPSPLVGGNHNTDWTSPNKRIRSSTARPRSLIRSSSADNILQAVTMPVSKPQTPTTLLRQVLDGPTGKLADNDSARFSTGTRSSDESDGLRRRFFHSSTSSFFPFPFSPSPSSRGGTLRGSQKRKKNRMVRRSASRITKMTSAICMSFVVLYLPFLIRKLIQLLPSSYGAIYVPEAVEIITLFGPFLSPLFNPIVYVFFNPHYRENFKQRYNKLRNKCACARKTRRLFSTSTFHFSSPAGSIRRKKRPKKPSAELPSSNPRTEIPLSDQHDDVFEEEKLVSEEKRNISPDNVTKPLMRDSSTDAL